MLSFEESESDPVIWKPEGESEYKEASCCFAVRDVPKLVL